MRERGPIRSVFTTVQQWRLSLLIGASFNAICKAIAASNVKTDTSANPPVISFTCLWFELMEESARRRNEMFS